MIYEMLEQTHKEVDFFETLKTVVNKDIPKSLDFVLSNVIRMDSLINSLLQLSRTGRIMMSVSQINVNKILHTIENNLSYQLSSIGAEVYIEDLDNCYGDENQLNQLFVNIFTNAIKYRKKVVPLEIKISSKKQNNKVIYSIKDKGIGMIASMLKGIWDVFYRANPN